MIEKLKLGNIPIPLLVVSFAVILVITSVTVIGSVKESGRPFEYICQQDPLNPNCQKPQPSPEPEMCTRQVEGIEVKFPCELPQQESEAPPLPQ